MSSQKRFKVCLLGEGRVGKTSIMLRFVRNQYDDKQASTLRASYLEKPVKVKGQVKQFLDEGDPKCMLPTCIQHRTSKFPFGTPQDKNAFMLWAPCTIAMPVSQGGFKPPIAAVSTNRTHTDGALLVYDITDEASFQRVNLFFSPLLCSFIYCCCPSWQCVLAGAQLGQGTSQNAWQQHCHHHCGKQV